MEGGYFSYNTIQIPGNRMKLYFSSYKGPYLGGRGLVGRETMVSPMPYGNIETIRVHIPVVLVPLV